MYQPHANLTVPCTGTSILALELCGKDLHHSPEVLRAGDFLKNLLEEHAPHWRIRPSSASTASITARRRRSSSAATTGTSSVRCLHDMLFKNQKDNGSWVAGGDGSTSAAQLFHGHVRPGPDGGVPLPAHLPARRGTDGQIAAARRRVSLSILERRLPPRSQALLGNAGRRNSVSRPTPDRTRSRSSRGRAFPSRAWERGNGTGPNSGGTPPAADSFPIPLDSAPCRRISICRARPRWSPTAPDGWIRIRSKAWRSGQGSARTSPQPRRR